MSWIKAVQAKNIPCSAINAGKRLLWLIGHSKTDQCFMSESISEGLTFPDFVAPMVEDANKDAA
jgi:hypothetical protein